jgi:hypothetical protein
MGKRGGLMHSGPSKTAEAIVAIFVPAVCREEVLGDLHERYRSPGQYALDAVRTVPLVIYSRILRTSSAKTRRRIMNSKALAITCGVLICVACILWMANAGHSSLPTLAYSQFVEKVRSGQVVSVVLKNSGSDTVQAICRLKDGAALRTVLPSDYRHAMAAMLENKVNVEIWDPSSGSVRLFIQFTPLFLCLGVWTFLMIYQGPNGRFFRSLMGR